VSISCKGDTWDLLSSSIFSECFFFFVTPEGFTTVVANEGLEKARAYLNQVPGTDGFTSPPKDAV